MQTDIGTFLKVSGKIIPVSDAKEASAAYLALWEKAISTTGRIIRGAVMIVDGQEVYRLSQNGKVWSGDDLIFNPHA